MEREGGRKGNERRDNVEGEGGTSRAKSKFLFLSLSLFLAALAHLIYPTIMG